MKLVITCSNDTLVLCDFIEAAWALDGFFFELFQLFELFVNMARVSHILYLDTATLVRGRAWKLSARHLKTMTLGFSFFSQEWQF